MPRVSFFRASLFALGLAGLLVAGCGEEPRVIDDLSEASYSFVSADSVAVSFPQDVLGDVLVLSYIYTNCPDVCPMTTANLLQVRKQLGAPKDVRFVTFTFDPKRDTPAVLDKYSQTYGIDSTRWMFLTADTATVNRFMQQMSVGHQVTDTTITSSGDSLFFISHSDVVTLVDPQGRVRQYYSGSRTSPEILVEDINKLRNGELIRGEAIR